MGIGVVGVDVGGGICFLCLGVVGVVLSFEDIWFGICFWVIVVVVEWKMD